MAEHRAPTQPFPSPQSIDLANRSPLRSSPIAQRVAGGSGLRSRRAAGAPERLSIGASAGSRVIRRRPPVSTAVITGPPRQRCWVPAAGPRRRAGEPALPRRRRLWPIPGPGPDRHRGEAHRESASTFHHLTNGAAGCRRSSNSRKHPAGPATRRHCGPPDYPLITIR
jgi:hypothetical protein